MKALTPKHYHEDAQGRVYSCTEVHYPVQPRSDARTPRDPLLAQQQYYQDPYQDRYQYQYQNAPTQQQYYQYHYVPPVGPHRGPSQGPLVMPQPAAPPPYHPRDPAGEHYRSHVRDPAPDYGATRFK